MAKTLAALDLLVWVYEAEEKYAQRGHDFSFEVSGQFTKSGNPVLIEIKESDFEE